MKIITLTNSDLHVLVDDNVFEELNKTNWSLTTNGYARGWFYNQLVSMHVVVMKLNDAYLNGLSVHHKDDNRLNNQRANLEMLDQSTHVLLGAKRPTKTGFTGINLHARGYYQARIQRSGHKVHLGSFYNLEDAKAARDKYLKDHGLLP